MFISIGVRPDADGPSRRSFNKKQPACRHLQEGKPVSSVGDRRRERQKYPELVRQCNASSKIDAFLAPHAVAML